MRVFGSNLMGGYIILGPGRKLGLTGIKEITNFDIQIINMIADKTYRT